MLRNFAPRTHGWVTRQSGYRVMLLRANGKSSLISMARTMKAANKLAREVVDQHLEMLKTDWPKIVRRPDRPRAIYVQVWNGSPFQGVWETPPPQRGGYQFQFHDRRRGPKQFHTYEKTQAKWKTGELVECLLLPKKTRRGGWRAQITGTQHEGTVTNWQDVPSHLCAGESVELKLCGISKQTGTAQFAWPS